MGCGRSRFPGEGHVNGVTTVTRHWFRLRDAVLDLLFPPTCAGCESRGQLLCSDCMAAAERILPPLCPRCGRPMPREQLCHVCQEARQVIDGIRAVVYFEGGLRRAVHRFKYHGVHALARPLAQLLVEYQAHNQLPADVVIPVPLHRERLAERGYNQAELLAQALGRLVRLPTIGTALTRIRATPPQVTLDAQERRSNVAGAFRAEERNVAGRRVLLIDDVCTTGATMEACAQALKAAGARSVWGLALARGR